MLEGDVYTVLSPLVAAGRCAPLTFPQPDTGAPQWPAIRYMVIASNNVADQCGTDTVDTDDTLVQIDLAAKTHGAVLALRDEVINAMLASSLPAIRTRNDQSYDSETRTYRVTLEYFVTPSSQVGSP